MYNIIFTQIIMILFEYLLLRVSSSSRCPGSGSRCGRPSPCARGRWCLPWRRCWARRAVRTTAWASSSYTPPSGQTGRWQPGGAATTTPWGRYVDISIFSATLLYCEQQRPREYGDEGILDVLLTGKRNTNSTPDIYCTDGVCI